MFTRRTTLATPLLLAAPARAQAAWPDRPTRWIVAFGAGGASDIFARMIGRAFAAQNLPPLVVENRPGAGGIVATEALLAAPADGATALHVDNGMMIYNPALFARLPFDPDRDLVMPAFIARFPFFVLVRADSPLRDFAALRAAGAREAITYATPAVASPHHMAMELLRRRAGFQATHVPYRGMPAVIQDMLAGRVDCAVADITNAMPHVTSGAARALVMLGDVRSPGLPEVPMAGELGVPDCVAYGWMGVCLHGSAPAELQQRVNSAVRAAMASPEVAAQLARTGAEHKPLSVAQCAAMVREESVAWRPLIRELGIRLDS